MFAEDDLLPLSGLQHFAFCERRWALIHIEQIWEENRFTAEGRVLHERAHSGDVESRPGVLIRRTLPLRSLRLGLSGQADIVEFQPLPRTIRSGIEISGRQGYWQAFPIEYKRSRDKAGSTAYRVQLCAQAICLEEMFSHPVPEGAVYDGTTRRRQVVPFTPELREVVEKLAERMRRFWTDGFTPLPVFTKACRSCSLYEVCHPEKLAGAGPVELYLKKFLRSDPL